MNYLVYLACFSLWSLSALCQLEESFVTSEGCVTRKTCRTVPEGCDETSCYFISWRESSMPDSIDIELLGPSKSNPGNYIAMAFGLRREMKDADAYFCGNNELKTAAIQGHHDYPLELPLENNVIAHNVSDINGRVQCRFTRPLSSNKPISEDTEHQFDLTTESYYLLLAGGELNDGYLDYHSWANVTEGKINFTKNFAKQREITTTQQVTSLKTPVHQPQILNATEVIKVPSSAEPEPTPEPESTPEPEAEATTTGAGVAVKSTQWFIMTFVVFTLLH